MTALILIIAVFGAMIGSFLNVVIYRVPRAMSVVAPPSACPSCGHRIRAFDNIPVLSWLILRGKCRDCGSAISMRYPAIELGTGVLFGLIAASSLDRISNAVGAGAVAAAVIALIAYCYFASISIALALIDLERHRLPNAIVLPAYVVGATLMIAASVGSGDYSMVIRGVIGSVAIFAIYLIMRLVYPSGMGLGDVKLAGVIGMFLAWAGWPQLAVGFFAAFLLGGVFVLVLLVAGRVRRTSAIPFGPWMLLGAWVSLFFGAGIFGSYLSLVGLGEI